MFQLCDGPNKSSAIEPNVLWFPMICWEDHLFCTRVAYAGHKYGPQRKTNCHPAIITAHHSQKNWNHVLWECSSQATFIILRLSPAIIPRDLLSSPNPDLFISTDLSFILYTLQLDRYRTHYPFSALTGCKQLTSRTTTKNSQRHISKLLLKTI